MPNANPLSIIHNEGWKFIALFAFVTMLLSMIWAPLGWIGFILTAWCAYFFRNPARTVPTREGLMVSPADGKVVKVMKVVPPSEYGMGEHEVWRISVFLNVFNVHVNRIPQTGTIEKVLYQPGQFLNASFEQASLNNERNTLVIKLDKKQKYAVSQIAGLIARRIVCEAKDGDNVKTGTVFGLIRFGSRADIFLPHGVNPMVIEGQTTIAGETILADLQHNEDIRLGNTI